MPKNNSVEHRSFSFEARKSISGEMYVEGYAATFNSLTVLYESDGIEYKEQIAPGAFMGADMSDVIFNYNHGGKVIARTRNKTLVVKADRKGLFIRARLDGTEEGRKLYEEIKGGYIDRMSFQFSVEKDKYDTTTHTRTINKFKRLYDVSAVDIPAYDATSIGITDKPLSISQEQDLRRRKLMLLATYF